MCYHHVDAVAFVAVAVADVVVTVVAGTVKDGWTGVVQL